MIHVDNDGIAHLSFENTNIFWPMLSWFCLLFIIIMTKQILKKPKILKKKKTKTKIKQTQKQNKTKQNKTKQKIHPITNKTNPTVTKATSVPLSHIYKTTYSPDLLEVLK